MRGVRLVGTTIALMIALAACSSATKAADSVTTNTTIETQTTTVGSASPSTATQPCGLTEFGATVDCWNAAHRRDPQPFTPQDLAFFPRTSTGQDRFAQVVNSGGAVWSFFLNLEPHTTEADALTQVRAELPPDLVQTTSGRSIPDDLTQASCAFVNFTSATVARVLGTPAIGDTAGTIGVSLETTTDNGDSRAYDPADVRLAVINPIASTQATPC